MKNWLKIAVVLGLLAGGIERLPAQVVPAVPAVPPAAGGLVGLCMLIDAKLQACKAKICACPLGQLITNSGKVFNAFGGGLLCPPCCPEVSDADKKKPSNTPEGACAKITEDEAGAKGRRAAVRCLAYADCNWFPEAEAALITALRTDRNECVRMEAAIVMGTGCCCTRKTIEALTISVSGSKKDGNPPENSVRVKAAAYASLQHCLECFKEVEVLDPLKKPETPDKLPDPRPVPPGPVTALQLLGGHTLLDAEPGRLEPKPEDPLVADARRALVDQKTAAVVPTRMPSGNRSLYQAFVVASKPVSVETKDETKPATSEPPALLPAVVIEEAPARNVFEMVSRGLRPRRIVPQEVTGPALAPPEQ